MRPRAVAAPVAAVPVAAVPIAAAASAAAPGATPPATRAPHRRRRRPWYRPKLRWFVLYLPMLVIALIAAAGLWAWHTVNGLYRVDVGDALSAQGGEAVNYLVVGSDSREGGDPDTEDGSTTVSGRRSDTIIVLRTDGDRSTMMSIPRDLWATNPATGKSGRINATYNAGPANLVKAVTSNLGIPIHRYVEVDFVSFAGMVDAMGGVTIDFPHAVSDRNSGLLIPTEGPHVLDGKTALAYVRSRHYTEIIDGVARQEPTADLGRQQRQQGFIRTVLDGVGSTRNPVTLLRVAGAASKGVRVDRDLGLGDLVSLARHLAGATPETVVLPTTPARKGGAAVLLLKEPDAGPVLAGFGANR
ncbi:MAG: LCP family protein [Microthrixaceae bacterium]|nr:LCP family protein [Microthrixaceae bacterium]HMT25098.1 LCP family protein [Microthrixaceae bacterium]